MAGGLKTRYASLPFAMGVDTKTDPNQLPIGKLAMLTDAIFTSPNQLQTRYGYKSMPSQRSNSDFNITSGQALMAYDNELVLCDDTSLYSFDSGAKNWTFKAPFQSINVQQAPVVRNPFAQQSEDENIAPNGIQCDAWEDSQGGSWYQITDTKTGQKVVPATQFDSQGFKPKVLIQGNFFVIIYIKIVSSDPELYMATLPFNLPAQTLTFTQVSPNSGAQQMSTTHPNYDACVMPDTANGSILYIAWCNNVASTSAGYVVASYSTQLNVLASVVKGSTVPRVISIVPTIPIAAAPQDGPEVFYCDTAGEIWNSFFFFDLTFIGVISVANEPSQGKVLSISGVETLNPPTLQVYWTLTAQAWEDDTDYAVGALMTNEGSVYCCIAPGTSNTMGGGPIGQGFDITDGTVHWAYSCPVSAVSSTNCIRTNTYIPALSEWGAPQDLLRSVSLSGKAYPLNDIPYIPIAYQSLVPAAVGLNGLQNTYFVSDGAGNIYARLLAGLGGGEPADVSIGPNPMSTYGDVMLPESVVNGTSASLPLLQTDLLTTDAAFYFGQFPAPGTNPPLPTVGTYTQTGVTSCSLNYGDNQDSYLNAQLGNSLIIGGGLLQAYDSQTVTELGFNIYPENITLVASDSTGSLTADATYYYSVTYEWEDAQGQTHRSAPSAPVSITLSGSQNTVTVTVPSLRLTAKNGVRIIIYRNISTGIIYYQALTTVVPTSSGGTNQPIENDKTRDAVAMIDGISDANIQGNVQLYTTGNVLVNLPTPPASDLTVNWNRLFALDPTNPNTIWCSQQVLLGTPVTMSEWLSYQVDARGGPSRAIRALDQHNIIWKDNSIFAMDGGPGPDSTGGSNNFSPAYIVTSDTGCTNPRSICLDATGYTFQGKGDLWYHIDRQLNVTYAGADAEGLLNNPVAGLMNGNSATSCTLMPYTQQVRMTLNNKTAVVLDYYVNQFCSHTINAVDACLWAGNSNQYCYLDSNGVVHGETIGEYGDDGRFVGLSLETGWIHQSDLMGWVRTWWVYLTGTILSPCHMTFMVSSDYVDAPIQNIQFDVKPGTGFGFLPFGVGPFGGQVPVPQWRFQLKKQLASSFKLYLSTSVLRGSEPGANVSLSGLGLQYGAVGSRKPNISETF